MAGPIEITILADAAKAAASVSDLGDSLEEVDGALGDLGDSGKDAGKDIERGLEDAAKAFRDLEKDAKESGSDTERYWKDAADEIERQLEDVAKTGKSEFDQVEDAAKDAADKIDRDLTQALDDAGTSSKTFGDDAEGGFRKASAATDDFKNEAKQNLSETVSSFRGDLEDIPQIAQDILGGVIPDLGAVGAGVAAAGAAAIGIAVQQLQGLADKINASKEKMGELVLTFADAEAGIASVDFVDTVRDWAVEIQDARSWFEVWQTDAVNNLEAVAKAAGVADTDLRDFWEAMTAPDQDSSLKYLEGLEARLKDVNDAWLEADTMAGTYGTASREKADALKAEKDALNDLVDPLREQIDNSKEAYDQSVLLRSIEEDVSEEYIRQRDAINANNEEIATNNELKAEAVTAAGNAFLAEGDYAATVRETTAAIAENGATTDANTEQGQANRKALVDLAGASSDYAKTAAETGASQAEVNGILATGRTNFLNAATAAGMGADEAGKLADSLGLVPDSTVAKVSTEGAAQAQTDAKNTKTELDKVAGKVYTAKVDVDVPSSATIGSLINNAVRNANINAVNVPVIAARNGVQARL